jgi:hypothetical protein
LLAVRFEDEFDFHGSVMRRIALSPCHSGVDKWQSPLLLFLRSMRMRKCFVSNIFGSGSGVAAIVALRANPAGIVWRSTFPTVFAGHRRESLREANIAIDRVIAGMIEAQSAIFFFYLDGRQSPYRASEQKP